ncbi:DUF1932 domain-containing protein [Sporosarcina highlanderae]|uniref:DUF1932 domain-containing protein n=1 Tax=Sporosarcina highlanderae TaxID=3035916 RepID=A0ABT8JL38_9BACL|nr:DUF1932 domain-containing protein [Sporosarcina highlanderae]MDN4605874.1 DUF1932 domain-containing protein [Sporosarcina highlanderae]
MKVGFIGFGEASFNIALGFNEEGIEGIIAFDASLNNPVYGKIIQERAEKANVNLLPNLEDVVQQSTVIFAAVPADKALDVCTATLPFLQRNTLYIDVSASSPDIKKAISENVIQKGALFVDAALMGPLPVYKHKVPIYASGNGADLMIKLLAGYQMDLTKISDIAGEASAVKLVRSVFMKGLSVLGVEMLEAARKLEIEELVIRSVSETMDKTDFENTLNRLVTGTAIHAERRFTEMSGSNQMLESINVNAIMATAVREKLEYMVEFGLKEKFDGVTPSSYKDVLDQMAQKQSTN